MLLLELLLSSAEEFPSFDSAFESESTEDMDDLRGCFPCQDSTRVLLLWMLRVLRPALSGSLVGPGLDFRCPALLFLDFAAGLVVGTSLMTLSLTLLSFLRE